MFAIAPCNEPHANVETGLMATTAAGVPTLHWDRLQVLAQLIQAHYAKDIVCTKLEALLSSPSWQERGKAEAKAVAETQRCRDNRTGRLHVRHASYTLTCMLNSWPLPRDSATYGSGPRVADAAVIGGGAPPAMPPPGPPPVVPPSAATPAGHAGTPPSDGKSDSSKVMGASGLALPPPPCVVESKAAVRSGD